MTHVMVPDGVLPWWLSAAGWLGTAFRVAFSLWRLRGVPAARMVPLVGVMTALMVLIMSVELVPIGYELHFTVLTGIIIGPWFGAVAALLFNILRALIGDGAFTNIGLNTVIIWLEIALGAGLWALLRPFVRWPGPATGEAAGPGPGDGGPSPAPGTARARSLSPAVAAGLATFVSLVLATVVFVGLIGLSTVDPLQVVETGTYDVRAGGFADAPFAGGLLNVHVVEGPEAPPGPEGASGGADPQPAFGAFALAVLALGALGALIEAVIVGAVAAFIARVRPELLGLRPPAAR